jgi:hypothetical protein
MLLYLKRKNKRAIILKCPERIIQTVFVISIFLFVIFIVTILTYWTSIGKEIFLWIMNGLSNVVKEDPQSFMQLFSPLVILAFGVLGAAHLHKRKVLGWVSIGVSCFALFLLIHAFWIFPDKPREADTDIPNFSEGTIGLRAWKSEVEFKDVRIAYGEWDTMAVLTTPQRTSTWRKVWFEGSSQTFAKFDCNGEIIHLKNCAVITDIRDLFPKGKIEFLTMAATVRFRQIDPKADWASAQLVFRAMPLAAPTNKGKNKKNFTKSSVIPEERDHPWKYIALELHPKKPYYSKCWISGEYPKQFAPKAYDNYYQRTRNLLRNGLWELKEGVDYRIYGTFYEGGWVRLILIDEREEETKDITLYEGRIKRHASK